MKPPLTVTPQPVRAKVGARFRACVHGRAGHLPDGEKIALSPAFLGAAAEITYMTENVITQMRINGLTFPCYIRSYVITDAR